MADGYQSDFICLSKGVPQGSILGPLLFKRFIHDFGTNVVNCKIHLYADDTVIYSAAPSVELALQNFQSDHPTGSYRPESCKCSTSASSALAIAR